jgi:heat shock protein HtpX
MNWVKTFVLMGAITLLALVVGQAIGGRQGMIVAFLIALAMNFGSYWFSDKIVLSMYGAREVSESDTPEVFSIVRNLSMSAGLPMPKVYVIPSEQPNAFATGRDPGHAAVAVTEGILGILSKEELAGVLAHELAHVKNRDILIGTIAATMAGAIMMLSRFGLFFGARGGDDDEGGGGLQLLLAMIVAPIAALLIQMWISRTREYVADAGGAEISGNPLALANALRKLERGVQVEQMDANPATAHMFIVNPFSAKKLFNLFSTHPPTEERIARLEAMRMSH